MTPIDQLKSVLCDPEDKCCIAGSDEDRAIIDRALEALAQPKPASVPPPWWPAVENILNEYGLQAIDFVADFKKALAQPPVAKPHEQEPVANPYAFEYGRDNGDGTYCVVIEKGDLIQTAPAVYNYVRPRNHHKDWPVKELFDRTPPPAATQLKE